MDHQQTKFSLLKAENLCLNSAMDDHIASSISQSAHSVILHEQAVFAGSGGWAWAVSLFSLFVFVFVDSLRRDT